jgi:O-antigen/teichoic acid export membrane protein
MLLTLPLTAIAAALGPSAIDLVYGDDYERAGTVAVVVLASVPVVALFHLAFGVVQGLGRLRVLVLASIAGTVADLAVAFVLIPDHGAVGAGIANAAAQVAASLVVAAFAARFAKGADYGIARLFRALVAAIAAGGVAWAAVVLMPAVLGIVAGGFAGLGMYAALLRLLRVVHADDRAWLAKNVGPLARFF